MGLKHISNIFNLDDLSIAERLVIMILGYHCNKKMDECWPSIKTVAKEAHMDYANVCKIIRSLEKKKYITRTFRNGEVKRFKLVTDTTSDSSSYHTDEDSITSASGKSPHSIYKKEGKEKGKGEGIENGTSIIEKPLKKPIGESSMETGKNNIPKFNTQEDEDKIREEGQAFLEQLEKEGKLNFKKEKK